jgi:hypothetical protein
MKKKTWVILGVITAIIGIGGFITYKILKKKKEEKEGPESEEGASEEEEIPMGLAIANRVIDILLKDGTTKTINEGEVVGTVVNESVDFIGAEGDDEEGTVTVMTPDNKTVVVKESVVDITPITDDQLEQAPIKENSTSPKTPKKPQVRIATASKTVTIKDSKGRRKRIRKNKPIGTVVKTNKKKGLVKIRTTGNKTVIIKRSGIKMKPVPVIKKRRVKKITRKAVRRGSKITKRISKAKRKGRTRKVKRLQKRKARVSKRATRKVARKSRRPAKKLARIKKRAAKKTGKVSRRITKARKKGRTRKVKRLQKRKARVTKRRTKKVARKTKRITKRAARKTRRKARKSKRKSRRSRRRRFVGMVGAAGRNVYVSKAQKARRKRIARTAKKATERTQTIRRRRASEIQKSPPRQRIQRRVGLGRRRFAGAFGDLNE